MAAAALRRASAISCSKAALTAGNPATIDIPGDRSASIELLTVNNGTYSLQIQVPGGSTTVRMPRDQILFVGGPNVPGGTLILMVDS